MVRLKKLSVMTKSSETNRNAEGSKQQKGTLHPNVVILRPSAPHGRRDSRKQGTVGVSQYIKRASEVSVEEENRSELSYRADVDTGSEELRNDRWNKNLRHYYLSQMHRRRFEPTNSSTSSPSGWSSSKLDESMEDTTVHKLASSPSGTVEFNRHTGDGNGGEPVVATAGGVRRRLIFMETIEDDSFAGYRQSGIDRDEARAQCAHCTESTLESSKSSMGSGNENTNSIRKGTILRRSFVASRLLVHEDTSESSCKDSMALSSPSENARLQPLAFYDCSPDASMSSANSESECEEDDGQGGKEIKGGRHRYQNIDDEAFEVSDEQAQAEDVALEWENYGSGYNTDTDASSGLETPTDNDSDYYPGKDGLPPSDDEGHFSMDDDESDNSDGGGSTSEDSEPGSED